MPAIITHDSKRIGIAETDSTGLGTLAWFHANVHAYSMHHAVEHEGYGVEDVEDVDCNDVESLISNIAERLGLSMECAFVPLSQSRNAKPGKDGKVWRSLNWRVTFKRYGRAVLETDYSQGEGYAPASKQKDLQDKVHMVKYELEHGKRAQGVVYESGPHVYGNKPLSPPSIGDVLQSLARDTDVLDSGGFESWASDFGYETDSREAERIYAACLETAMKLRSAIGEHALAELRLAASFN